VADRKISDLTALTTPATGDLIPIVDISEAAAADKNKSITVGELLRGAPDGTAAAPSVAFTGSGTDTGFYSDAANTLAASTGGTNALHIDSSQRVGINTTSPSQLLHLSSSGPRILLTHTSANSNAFLDAGTSGVLEFSADDNNVAASSSVRFKVDGGEKARIDSSGRLGLGTSSPDSLLDIQGAAPTITLNDTNGTDDRATIQSTGGALVFTARDGTADGEIVFKKFDGTTTDETLRITNTGNVGIGTTSPANQLHLANATNAVMKIEGTGGYAQIILDGNGAGNNFLVSDDPLAIYTAGAERARIDGSGRLLVGTSSAINTDGSSLLQVVGTSSGGLLLARNDTETLANDQIGVIRFFGNDTLTAGGYEECAAIKCNADADHTDSSKASRLAFLTTASGAESPTERMRITNGGSALIGKTSTGNSIAGFEVSSTGLAQVTVNNDYVALFNRKTSDGVIIYLQQDEINEGNISVSGGTVSYNQFLGSHWAALTDWSRPEIKIGTILETINELTDWKYAVIEVEGEQKKICYNGTAEIGSTVTVEYEGEEYEGIVELETNPEFNKAVKVKVNDTVASKAIYGVFVGWNTDKDGDGGIWNDMYVGAVGNYVIRMAEGQEPEIGDLVEADGTGCAVVQDDDIIRTKTVAKVTSTIPQVTYDDGSFLVTCVLYCG